MFKVLDYPLMKVGDTLFIQAVRNYLTEDRVLAIQIIIIQNDIDLVTFL